MGLQDFTNGQNNNPNNPNNSNGGTMIPIQIIPQTPNGTSSQSDIDVLDFLIDYNEKFKNNGNTLFRDAVVQQTLGVLLGKNKPNAVLVGPAGVGKTRIVEDIAYRIATQDALIPDALKDFTIYELVLSGMVAGSTYVGQLESKINEVVEFASNPDNKAIIFIDEIHMLMSDSQTYEKIAQILKPALARGDMKVIGATTSQEYRKLKDDPAFNRRFSPVLVEELSREQTVEILKHARPSYLAHYNNKVSFTDDVLETVAILADRYRVNDSHRPDGALTILDRAIGSAIIDRKVMEQKALTDPMLAQMIQAVPVIPITEKIVTKTAKQLMTGCISTKENIDIDSLKNRLSVIKGQNDAIEPLIQAIQRHDLNLFPNKKPFTALFIGPSGVGKTEVTKLISSEITGTKPIILNMTEFHSSASINRIIGAPAGYVGSDSNMELPFDCLATNPYQVILLDEFEKCDPSVQRLFMNVFDEGELKTNRGDTVDFSKCIIIATTNAAHKEQKSSVGFMENNAQNQETSIKELSKWFDSELLNRFSYRVTFHELSKETYRDIIVEKYHTEVARIRSERRVNLLDDIPDDDLEQIVKDTYEPAFGARPAERAVCKYIEDQILNTATSATNTQ